MAVITNSDAYNTEFTPAAGDFIVSATKRAALLRKNNSSAAFCVVGIIDNQAMIVDNPIAGAVYKWAPGDSTGTVSADQ